jgi:hypothetical protein
MQIKLTQIQLVDANPVVANPVDPVEANPVVANPVDAKHMIKTNVIIEFLQRLWTKNANFFLNFFWRNFFKKWSRFLTLQAAITSSTRAWLGCRST